MLDYLRKVLELTRPYRFRFGLGLLCGFLSGALAFTLPVSLKLAVDSVFPQEGLIARGSSSNDYGAELPAGSSSRTTAEQKTGGTRGQSMQQALTSRLPAPLMRTLDNLVQWFRPADHPSTGRLLLAKIGRAHV